MANKYNKKYVFLDHQKQCCIAKGYELEDDKTFAVILIDTTMGFEFKYSIIDIKSGLALVRAHSQKKLMERYNELKSRNNYQKCLSKSRSGDKYKQLCEMVTLFKRTWKL